MLPASAEALESRLHLHATPVHSYLAGEALDYLGSQFAGIDLPRTTFIQGAVDEDAANTDPWRSAMPYSAHFWAHDASFARIFDDGYLSFDSAANRAFKYFSGGYGLSGVYDAGWSNGATAGHGIAWMYQNGQTATAFDWLGRVAHLVQDMTTPAHAHNDAHGTIFFGYDAYEEEYIGVSDHWTQWAWPAGSRGGPAGDVRLPQAAWPTYQFDPIYELFKETAGRTDDFDSDDADGQIDGGSRIQWSLARGNYISDANCQAIGDTLMPLAIKAVAELVRYFYRVVDATAPAVSLPGLSTNPASPTVSNVHSIALAANAADPVSGVGINKYHYYVSRWTGSEWTAPIDQGPSGPSRTLGGLTDGAYAVYVTAENAAGLVGASPTVYLTIDSAPTITGTPAADAWTVELDAASGLVHVHANGSASPSHMLDAAALASLPINAGDGADVLTVESGVPLSVLFDGGAGLDSLAVHGGTVRFAADQDLAGLTIDRASAGVQGLDLAGHSLRIYGAGLGGVEAALHAQVAPAGSTDGIHDSTASSHTNAVLGITDQRPDGAGTPCVLVKLTRAGDMNLDSATNFSDLLILARNYNQPGMTWDQGNVNYSADGIVDFSDLLILAQNYNQVFVAPALRFSSTPVTEDAPW